MNPPANNSLTALFCLSGPNTVSESMTIPPVTIPKPMADRYMMANTAVCYSLLSINTLISTELCIALYVIICNL